MQRTESNPNSTNYQCYHNPIAYTITWVSTNQLFHQKVKNLYSDGGRQSGPVDVPPSYSYDSMPDAIESIPYGQPGYSSKRRREKRELAPGYGQTSVQSKCIEPPRIVQNSL